MLPTHAIISLPVRPSLRLKAATLACALAPILASNAWAHGVSSGDKGFIQHTFGVRIVPFLYLGAKHMVTGYDHLLFLAGVIFYLYRSREVATYVTLFAVGHSVTLILGVLTGISVNAFLIDAVIGFSVVYKALDNMGALRRWLGFEPNAKVATAIFGLMHGFGLATKLLDFEMDSNGLVTNLISFNVGVEVGQLLALGAILIAMSYWRRSPGFSRRGYSANVAIMTAGFVLVGYQLAGFFALRS